MIRIAVLNIKGGSGKSTLATNLAAWLAQCGRRVAMVDYDPQESAMNWLGRRPAELPRINGVSAKGSDIRLTRVYRLVEGLDPEFTIMDTPAAISAQNLIYFCRDAHKVLVPVLPSRIDIDVGARMIRNLYVHGGIKKGDDRLGIIASRVRRDTLAYKNLQRFLAVLEIPVIADIRDSQNYVRCAESGMGVTELQPYQRAADIGAWESILHWIEPPITLNTESVTKESARQHDPSRIARLVSLLPERDP
jgi:chromosome partitioning protein